jgi:guanylate kinase
MILVISGPSAVGKDALCRWITQHYALIKEVPFTTRAPRHTEAIGEDYHFVSVDTFQRLIHSRTMVEWEFALGAYYGTSLSQVARERTGAHIVLQALGSIAHRLRSRYSDIRTVLLVPEDGALVADRLRQRGYKDTELRARLAHGRRELANPDRFDHVIVGAEHFTSADRHRLMSTILGDFIVSGPQLEARDPGSRPPPRTH